MNTIRLSLWAGVLAPVLYFGAQAVGWAFYPGYDPLTQVASELGASASSAPDIFNSLVMATGVATLLAASGFVRRLPDEDSPLVVAWLVGAALILSGAASLWAGAHPLPDPRHNPGPLVIAIIALPVLLAIALWRAPDARALKAYLVANLVLLALAAPANAGLFPIDRASWGGLLQRVTALIAYLPIGVVAWRLLSRARR